MQQRKHRRPGQFFLGDGRLSHFWPKIFSPAPEKTATLSSLTCKITLPDSPHPVIISKNPGFWALHLAWGQSESRFFRLMNTKNISFSFLAARFCTKNLVFVARKIMALPESGGCRPSSPWLVRQWQKGRWETDNYLQQKFGLSGGHVNDESLSVAAASIDLSQRPVDVASVCHAVHVRFHRVAVQHHSFQKLL